MHVCMYACPVSYLAEINFATRSFCKMWTSYHSTSNYLLVCFCFQKSGFSYCILFLCYYKYVDLRFVSYKKNCDFIDLPFTAHHKQVCGSGGNVLNNNRTVTTNSSSGIKTSVPWTPMTTPMTTPRQQIAPTEKASSGNKPSKNSVNHDHSCNCHHNNYGNLVLSIPLTAVTVAFVFFVAWHRRTLTRRLWQPVSTNDESVISNSAVASQEQLKGRPMVNLNLTLPLPATLTKNI